MSNAIAPPSEGRGFCEALRAASTNDECYRRVLVLMSAHEQQQRNELALLRWNAKRALERLNWTSAAEQSEAQSAAHSASPHLNGALQS
jgi:hypothetical protein